MDLSMSIASLSTAMAQQQVSSDISTAVLSKALDFNESSGADLAKMMEQSVTPYLGGSIDLSV